MNMNTPIFFISDLHLGVPDPKQSNEREKKVVEWLHTIAPQASEIVLLGDIFDFWFEYNYTVPKGYVRLLGTLAHYADLGIPIHFFSGNHDMWTFGYLEKEIGMKVYHAPQYWNRFGFSLFLAHGDGLGPRDYSFKFFKSIFRNPFFQWIFARIHPNFSFGIAHFFSRNSRNRNRVKDVQWKGEEKERLVQFCAKHNTQSPTDFYIFGHRHLPHLISPDGKYTYVNLGDWISHFTYGKLDETGFSLISFQSEIP
jgi:UDP-2,3-diacylglucosamine hydrolase